MRVKKGRSGQTLPGAQSRRVRGCRVKVKVSNVWLAVGDGPFATSPLPRTGSTVLWPVLTPWVGGWDKWRALCNHWKLLGKWGQLAVYAVAHRIITIGLKGPGAEKWLAPRRYNPAIPYFHAGLNYQSSSELFKPRMLYFFVDNGAMNAPRYWQHRNEHSAILATMLWTLRDIGNCAMMPANGPSFPILTERWISWLRWLLGS